VHSNGQRPRPSYPDSRHDPFGPARVLTRPQARTFRVASTSDPAKHYTLTYEANEATCTCPGFEYRGTCRHARELKAAMVEKRV
jgi:hypothetical protein